MARSARRRAKRRRQKGERRPGLESRPALGKADWKIIQFKMKGTVTVT